MIYTLDKMLCTKMLQARGGTQLPLKAYCVQPRSYNIATREGVTYKKTQAHLKPYQPQCKKPGDEHSDNNMQTLKANCKQLDNGNSKINQVQSHTRPKRDIKPSIKLDLWCIKWIV